MMKQIAILYLITVCLTVAGHAQTVYQKDRWGTKLYYMTENTIRQKDKWGEQLLWYDAATQQVRQKDRWGQPLGQTIRQKDRWGTPLFYLDGQTLRQKDRWGTPVYYFDFIPDRWQIACIVLM